MFSLEIKTVGDRIQTEKVMQLHNDRIRSFITPKIQINQGMVAIKDSTTISGIKECECREEAKKTAITTRDELKQMLSN